MANPTYKSTAITRAGYEFQDLVGIETLVRFYHDPDLFHWVMLEADDEGFGALDDVIAARTDGTFEFTQVKFTVDDSVYHLDWSWLLHRRANGTSMLSKWAASVAKVRGMGPISACGLRTNRVPSTAFLASMNGQLVDLSFVDHDTRASIEEACGGAAEAASFFSVFEFRSMPDDLDSLAAKVRLELVPSAMLATGWPFLREQVRRWAIMRNEPPDGRILYKHIAQVITKQRPEPIQQEFRVPPSYAPPSSFFHEAFVTRIKNEALPLTVLWGTPGRGKSTYLSYLTAELRAGGDPVIRHHYFLSGDDTADRVSCSEIAHSFVSQLNDHYPNSISDDHSETDKLHDTLAAAAVRLAQLGKRLHIIVDGLDHVWRDYQRVDQLNHLFGQLMPLPPNVTLIIGTQRVAEAQLPSRLVANAAKSDWIEIPAMDALSVHRWINVQDEAGRLLTRTSPAGTDRASKINEIGEAFFEISGGHPLHLIFAFETLVQKGSEIDADAVKLLPACPDGDIRSYYANLWAKLSSPARDILHALAACEFNWPSVGVRQCLGSYEEIAFLLEFRNSGIRAFHASILAYATERDDHDESVSVLLPRIVEWLKNLAPEFWRWGWLWLTEAKMGNDGPLLSGASREWAVTSLATGWPEKQIARILEEAEQRAFKRFDLPTTIRLRSVKHRVWDARRFQIQDFSKFEEAAIRSSNNEQQSKNLIDELPTLPISTVAILPLTVPPALFDEFTQACVEELSRRIEIWLELRHKPDTDFMTLAHGYLDLVALQKMPDLEAAWRFIRRFRKPFDQIRYFTKKLAASRNYDALIELHSRLEHERWAEARDDIEDQIVRVASGLGADPFLRLRRGDSPLSPLQAAWCSIRGITGGPISSLKAPIPLNRERYDYGIDIGLARYFEALFFAAFAHCRNGSPIEDFDAGLPDEDLGWLKAAFNLIMDIAERVAKGDLPTDLSAVFTGAEEFAPVYHGRERATENDQAQYRSFAAALRKIAFDLHLVGSKSGLLLVTKDVLEKARRSPHWNDVLWLEFVAEFPGGTMTADAASIVLHAEADRLSSTITIFNERSESWALLSRVAWRHALPISAAFARRSADCLLGYGYRKDSWIFEVLASIEAVGYPDSPQTLSWISSLVPIIDQITEFTDGSGTSYAQSEIIDVTAAKFSDRLPLFYLHHLEKEEWSLAVDCLNELARRGKLELPESQALLSTFLDPRELETLRSIAVSDPLAEQALKRQIDFLGGMPTDHSDRAGSSHTELVEPDPPNDARGADEFQKVVDDVAEVHDRGNRRKHFAGWLNRHKVSGHGKSALNSVRAYFEREDTAYGADDILDIAVAASLEIEGREFAYAWLVKAHVERHGWQSHWTSSDEIIDRLRFSAENFPERWRQYLSDTAEPASFYKKRGDGLVIGSKYLVEYLLMAGQRAEAEGVVEAMVRATVEEVQDLRIPEASWFH